MANMSYCRFENTSSDVIDCVEALERIMDSKTVREDLGETEASGLAELAVQAVHIAEVFQEELGKGFGRADVEDFIKGN